MGQFQTLPVLNLSPPVSFAGLSLSLAVEVHLKFDVIGHEALTLVVLHGSAPWIGIRAGQGSHNS